MTKTKISIVKIGNVEGIAEIIHFYNTRDEMENAPDMENAKDEILNIMKKYNILILNATNFRFEKEQR